MAVVNRGFEGRSGSDDRRLPPGQHLTDDFPVLSASVTPLIPKDKWELTVTSETGAQRRWRWHDLLALPAESVVADILLPNLLHLSQNQLSHHGHPSLRLNLRRHAQRRPSPPHNPEIVLRLSSGLPPKMPPAEFDH